MPSPPLWDCLEQCRCGLLLVEAKGGPSPLPQSTSHWQHCGTGACSEGTVTVLIAFQLVRKPATCGACHLFLPELVCILQLAYVLRRPCRVAVLSTVTCHCAMVAQSLLPQQFPKCLRTTVQRNLRARPSNGADQSFDSVLVW